MKWYEDYNRFLNIFINSGTAADETTFYFKNEEADKLHYIGYIPGYEKPYWAGYCDIPDGCAFYTAEELFNAEIYDEKSIHDRWSEIVFCEFGGISIESWIPDENQP